MNITHLNSTIPKTTPPTALQWQTATSLGIIGLFSMMGSLTIIALIFRLKLYKQMHTRLVLYLCCADLIQEMASVTSLAWISSPPHSGQSSCIFQSVMFQTGNVASAIASLWIGLYVWCNIHYLYYSWIVTPGKKFEIFAASSIFGVSALFTIIGELRSVVTGVAIYVPVGFQAWCWMSTAFAIERFMLHYTWIMIICAILFLLYFHIMITLNKNESEAASVGSDKDKKKKLALKMVGFPIIFFWAFMPLCIERLYYVAHQPLDLPNQYISFAVSIFVANGFFNATLYGYTRKLFSKMKESITGEDTKATYSSQTSMKSMKSDQ